MGSFPALLSLRRPGVVSWWAGCWGREAWDVERV